jgi:sporulation protein YlmC with PRC-barrel domain
MSGQQVDLALGLLDHQLVDVDGRRCGKVDDLDLEWHSKELRVAAVLAGPPAWRGRGTLGRLSARLGPGRTTRVPWAEVREIASGIHLRKSARELRLGHGDDRARPWLERFPKAQ